MEHLFFPYDLGSSTTANSSVSTPNQLNSVASNDLYKWIGGIGCAIALLIVLICVFYRPRYWNLVENIICYIALIFKILYSDAGKSHIMVNVKLGQNTRPIPIKRNPIGFGVSETLISWAEMQVELMTRKLMKKFNLKKKTLMTSILCLPFTKKSEQRIQLTNHKNEKIPQSCPQECCWIINKTQPNIIRTLWLKRVWKAINKCKMWNPQLVLVLVTFCNSVSPWAFKNKWWTFAGPLSYLISVGFLIRILLHRISCSRLTPVAITSCGFEFFLYHKKRGRNSKSKSQKKGEGIFLKSKHSTVEPSSGLARKQ